MSWDQRQDGEEWLQLKVDANPGGISQEGRAVMAGFEEVGLVPWMKRLSMGVEPAKMLRLIV